MSIVVNDGDSSVSVSGYFVDVKKYNSNHGKDGRFASGNSMGGSGASSEQEIKDAHEDLRNRAQGAQEQIGRPSGVWTQGQQQMRTDRLQGTADGYNAAANYVGNPTQMAGLKTLMGNNDNAYAQAFTSAVSDAVQLYGHLKS